MDVRLRLPELFDEKAKSPYRVARESGGRISMSTIYRLKREAGQLETFRAEMLDALCDVFEITPGELFERDVPKKGKRKH